MVMLSIDNIHALFELRLGTPYLGLTPHDRTPGTADR